MHRQHQPPTRVPARPADPRLRVGDAERGQVIDQLAEHHAAGRLTLPEFEERMTSAWTARTGPSWRPWSATCRPRPVRPRGPRPSPVPAWTASCGPTWP